MPRIAVINQKGGAGKSTPIAVHLARWLQRQKKPILIVDIVRQRQVITDSFGQRLTVFNMSRTPAETAWCELESLFKRAT